MRVIDLLNKIANGEEVPKKLCFWEREYIYDKEYNCYLCQVADNEFIDLLDNNNDDLQSFLNDEVEILEEETKPLTKQDLEALGYACGEIQKCFINGWNKSLNNEPFKENKKIEKIQRLNQDNFQCVSNLEISGQSANYFEYGLEDEIRDIVDKINEIIDILNKE